MTTPLLWVCLILLVAITIIPPLLSVLWKKDKEINGLFDEVTRLEKRLNQTQKTGPLSAVERQTARIHAANEASAAYLNSIRLDAFRKRIAGLAGCDDQQAWETFVDEASGGLLSLAKKQLPPLPQDDISLIGYLLAGLSYVTIRLLTGETLSNLYSRKSRLIDRLLSSGDPDSRHLAEELQRRPIPNRK